MSNGNEKVPGKPENLAKDTDGNDATPEAKITLMQSYHDGSGIKELAERTKKDRDYQANTDGRPTGVATDNFGRVELHDDDTVVVKGAQSKTVSSDVANAAAEKSIAERYDNKTGTERDSHSPERIKQVKELLKKLGSEDFNERENAQQRLVQMGKDALPYVRESLGSEDPEVVNRCRHIVSQVAEPVSRTGNKEETKDVLSGAPAANKDVGEEPASLKPPGDDKDDSGDGSDDCDVDCARQRGVERSRRRALSALQRMQQIPADADQSAVGAAREVFGDAAYANLNTNVNDGYPHGLNAVYTLMYLTGGEAQRKAAIEGLQQEAMSGNNPSALQVLKNIALVEAVRKLNTSSSKEETQSALRELAGLEAGNERARAVLEKFPTESEVIDGRQRGLDLGGQGERVQMVEQARRGAQEAHSKESYDTDSTYISGVQGSSSERKEALSRLAATAGMETRAGESGGAQKALAKLGVLDASADITGARTPEDAARALTRLVGMAAGNNDHARQALGDLDTANMIRVLRDSGHRSEQMDALERLKKQLAPQTEELEGLKAKSATDILASFKDKDSVEKAREDIRRFDADNFSRADTAFTVLLDRKSTADQKTEALKSMHDADDSRMRVLRTGSFDYIEKRAEAALGADGVRDSVRSAIKAINDRTISEEDRSAAVSRARQDLEKYQALAKGTDGKPGNSEALQYLSKLGDQTQVDGLLKDLGSGMPEVQNKALEKILAGVPSSDATFNELRLGRILRSIKEDSKPEDYDKALAALKEEQKFNPDCKDWIAWTEVGRSVATISQASSPQEIKEAVGALVSMSQDDNPYARRALAGVLIADADKRSIVDWYRTGDGGVDSRPAFLPSLPDLKGDCKQAWQEARLQVAQEIGRQVEAREAKLAAGADRAAASLDQSEASALAIALAKSRADGGEPDKLASSIQKTLETAIDGHGRTAALKGLFSVIENDPPGARELGYLFARGNKDDLFRTAFGSLEQMSRAGNEAAMSVMAATASGLTKDESLGARAAKALELAGSDEALRSKVFDSILAANGRFQDHDQLLRTLGIVAANLKTPEQVPEAVRAAIQHGVESSDKKTSAGAASGMMAIAHLWTEKEAKLAFDHLSGNVVEGLRDVHDKIPEPLREQLISDLCGRANPLIPGEFDEKSRTLQALSALAPYLSSRQLSAISNYGGDQGLNRVKATGLSSDQAGRLQTEAGKALLSAMTRGSDEVKRDAVAALEKNSYKGIDDQVRQVFVSMAKDEPFNLELYEKVNARVYDTGLPRPIAGIFKNWDVPAANDKELFDKAKEATSHYENFERGKSGADIVRRVASNIEIVNALSPELRQKLFAPENASAEEQKHARDRVSPQQVAALLEQGTLNDSRFAFLLKDLGYEMNRLECQSFQQEQASMRQVRTLEGRHSQAFADLLQHTSKDVPLLDKLAYIGVIQSPVIGPVNIFDPYRDYELKQNELLAKIRPIECELIHARRALRNASQEHAMYEFSRDIGTYSDLANAGRQKEADRMLVGNLWRKHGEYLQTFAPSAYGQLFPLDNTQPGRSALGRLHDANLAVSSRPPELSYMTERSMKQGLQVLASLPAPGDSFPPPVDLAAIRQQALAAVESSPGIGKVGDISRELEGKLPELQSLVQAAYTGRKYNDYVADVQSRGREIKQILGHFTDSDRQALRKDINEIYWKLQARGEGEVKDPESRRALEEKLKNLQDMDALLDPRSSTREKLDKFLNEVTSPNFRADDFANWVMKNGPELGATVVAVAATVSACATFGLTSPLAVAACSSAAALIASEGTKEGLYQINSRVGFTGLGTDGVRSRGGDWFEKLEDRTLWENYKALGTEVYGPYVAQVAFDTAMAFGVMGLSKFVMAGLSPSSVLSMEGMKQGMKELMVGEGKTITQLSFELRKAAAIAGGESEAGVFMREFMSYFPKELAVNAGFTGAQICGNGLIQDLSPDAWKRTLHDADATVQFGLSTTLAMGQGLLSSIRPGANRITHFQAKSPADEATFLNGYRREGCRVTEVQSGRWEVLPPGAAPGSKPFVLERGDGLPQAKVFPDGYTPAAEAGGKPLETSLTTADGHTWQQTPGEGQFLKEVSGFSEHYRRGEFDQALTKAGGSFPADQPIKQIPVEASAQGLTDPQALRRFLSDMGDAGAAVPSPKSGGDGCSIELPQPIIEISQGLKVDLLTGRTPEGKALSPSQQAQFDTFKKGEIGQRILAEQALIAMEERIHLQQLAGGGHVLSPSFARFASETGEKGGALHAALRGTQTGGRAGSTYEQEAILALHDSNPDFWTADMLNRHFGNQHEGVRKPVVDWLRAQEKGQSNLARGVDNVGLERSPTSATPGWKELQKRINDENFPKSVITDVNELQGLLKALNQYNKESLGPPACALSAQETITLLQTLPKSVERALADSRLPQQQRTELVKSYADLLDNVHRNGRVKDDKTVQKFADDVAFQLLERLSAQELSLLELRHIDTLTRSMSVSRLDEMPELERRRVFETMLDAACSTEVPAVREALCTAAIDNAKARETFQALSRMSEEDLCSLSAPAFDSVVESCMSRDRMRQLTAPERSALFQRLFNSAEKLGTTRSMNKLVEPLCDEKVKWELFGVYDQAKAMGFDMPRDARFNEDVHTLLEWNVQALEKRCATDSKYKEACAEAKMMLSSYRDDNPVGVGMVNDYLREVIRLRLNDRPAVLFRGDSGLDSRLDSRGRPKAHFEEINGENFLVGADPQGSTSIIQHLNEMYNRAAKKNSPYISMGDGDVVGKYGGGKGIEFDMEGLRKAIDTGEVKGVEIIEHSQLIKLIEESNLNRNAKIMLRRFVEHDNEFLIKGKVPARFIKTAELGK